MVFVGNCRYHPDGFAPSWRERLDDGALDVRIVDADTPWSRTRLVAAVLTGRLGRCRAYDATTTTRLVIESPDGAPVRLAVDGETSEGATTLVFEKHARPLRVFAPPIAVR
jgi:undecaprenyl-diphosphatase